MEAKLAEAKLDMEHFKSYWAEQQKGAKHMESEKVLKHIDGFIKSHDTCALATCTGDYVRCTPMEYIYMDGEFYLYSEGGNKFICLENNLNVSVSIYEYHGDRNDSHGLQIAGRAELYPPRCELFKKVLAFVGIPYDSLKASETDAVLIKITPEMYEMYDTDFVKQGFDVRQYYSFK